MRDTGLLFRLQLSGEIDQPTDLLRRKIQQLQKASIFQTIHQHTSHSGSNRIFMHVCCIFMRLLYPKEGCLSIRNFTKRIKSIPAPAHRRGRRRLAPLPGPHPPRHRLCGATLRDRRLPPRTAVRRRGQGSPPLRRARVLPAGSDPHEFRDPGMTERGRPRT